MIQCTTCGSPVEETVGVCENCGTEVSAPSAAPATSESPVADSTATTGDLAPASAATDESALARLELVKGGTPTGQVFVVGQRSVVGRFDAETGPVDIDLAQVPDAAYVGRRHAELWRDGGGQWFVKDLKTKNKTFLRRAGDDAFAEVVGEEPVHDGDLIAFANAQFEFHVAPGN